jgi:hypothetical protein
MPSTKPELFSPVEERHIDYILEEEFTLNRDFLRFFLDRARLGAPDQALIFACTDEAHCSAVRSVTTCDGESDLLVTYGPLGVLPTAILIEDKIRAGFQPKQQERYGERGGQGKGKEWAHYWTCLVAPAKYIVGVKGFDASVAIETLLDYFAGRTDDRSQFRAQILKRTIAKFEATGVQILDSDVTDFRAMYAAECEKRLDRTRWFFEKARDAWWDDTWFRFRSNYWPKGIEIRHQARTGFVDLILAIEDEGLLGKVLEFWLYSYPNNLGPRVKIIPIGKGKKKSAFQIPVPKIVEFTRETRPDFDEIFSGIEFLSSLYEGSCHLLPESLRCSGPSAPGADAQSQELRALRAMLHGFMRSTVISLGTEMPYPLPEPGSLSEDIPSEKRYFASPGLMGGFKLTLSEDENHRRYILSEYWGRQWGASSVRHKITTSEVRRLPDEPADVNSF